MPPPRKTLRRQDVPGTARYLTFSCYCRLPLLGSARIKDHFVDTMTIALAANPVSLLAWVVMPEHVHLIMFPEKTGGIAAFLRTLKRPFARSLLDRWRSLDAGILPKLEDRSGQHHVWQAGGGYDRNVVGIELVEKIAYVHHNPVRRGLSSDSLTWRWSSAAAYAGRPNAAGPPIAFELLPPVDREVF